MSPPPQKSGGPNIALIIVIVLAVLAATGIGGCLLCVFVAKSSSSKPVATAPGPGPTPIKTASNAPSSSWITSEHPYVKFLAPPGWHKDLKGDWGVFTAPDKDAVFAFTTFDQPGESTRRLTSAASVLGVSGINWKPPKYTTIGKDGFRARMAEGSCSFRGPGGYIWYATVDSGSADQILLIYTVSVAGDKTDKEAVLASIRSLQRR